MNIGFIKQNLFGGTDLLLDKAFDWFLKKGHCCYFLDENEGYIRNKKFDIVVVPTSEIYTYFCYKKKWLKSDGFFVWSMGDGAYRAAFFHPDFYKKHRFFLFFIDFLVKRSLLHLLKSKSIMFTDVEGLKSDLKGLNIKLQDDIILPIAINNIKKHYFDTLNEQKVANIGWLGRVSSDFKVDPLFDLILDVNENYYHLKKFDVFYIIGEGDGLKDLMYKVSKLNLLFEIQYVNHIDNNELSKFLTENLSFLFSMGTSVLEGTKNGIPSIIVNPYSKEDKISGRVILSEKYRIAYHSIGYSLGEFFNERNSYQNNMCFTDIANYLKAKKYNEMSKLSLEFSRMFSEDIVFKKMSEALLSTKKHSDKNIFLQCLFYFLALKRKIKKMFKLLREI